MLSTTRNTSEDASPYIVAGLFVHVVMADRISIMTDLTSLGIN